jgi:hypothetical protein
VLLIASHLRRADRPLEGTAADRPLEGTGANRSQGGAAFRWLTRLIAGSAVVLLPWTAYLAEALPSTVSARHWPLVWAGLDGVMALGLALTAWFAIHRDRRLAFPAVSTATLLVADAWFDVCTAAAGRPLAFALIDMCVELAEAAACLALAIAVWRDTPEGASR